MYDQFDKQLAERIKHVFDTYEDGSADEGWAKLRKSFPEKKSRKALIYWASSAAAILFICAGLWFFERPALNEQIAKTESTGVSHSGGATKAPAPAGSKMGEPTAAPDQSAPQLAGTNEEPRPEHRTKAAVNIPASSETIRTESIATAPQVSIASAAVALDSARSDVNTARYAAAHEEVPASGQQLKTNPQDDRSVAERLAAIKEPATAKTPARKQGKFSVGIFAGSFVNYSEGSKAGMNPGVGLLSELAISKKLKISTGLTLAQNTLKFDHAPTPEGPGRLMDSPNSSPMDSKESMTNSFMARTSSFSYSMDGYNASLLGLDIPVNLKYMLVENKRDLYVLAGLSSNFFIDESYTYKYSDISYTLDGESRSAKESTTKNSSFDFARMLNLSVGFGYPVGKQSKLSVEPFVKYPLGGLGSQDIRFGSAGLNLKFNFSTGH